MLLMEKQLLNTDAALEMLSGETELYKMLIDAFSNESPAGFDSIKKFISQNKYEDARITSHKIKGSASQLGAENLTFALQYLEDALAGRKLGDVEALCKNADFIFSKTIAFIKEYRSTL